jgi:hypothetical protein
MYSGEEIFKAVFSIKNPVITVGILHRYIISFEGFVRNV